MLQFRALFSGPVRPSNGFLDDDQKEAYTSVESLKVEEKPFKAHTKRYDARGRRKIWKFCNRIPFIGSILRRHIPERKSITVHCLDDGLLTRIYQHLPLVDQICLALSCKKFLSCYKVLAKDSSMLPPQRTENHLPLSYVNSQYKLRVQLLVRLENFRWAYCAECLSLKPRRLFTPDALNVPALERRCARYDGGIELCPCLHLTLRDRNHVSLLLWSSDTPCGEVRYGIFGFERDGWQSARHSCPFYSNRNRTVQISTKFCISNMGILRLHVWYYLRVSSGDSFVEAAPVFACPHLDLIPLIHTAGDYTRCFKCYTDIWRQSAKQEDPSLVTFSVNRSLGYSDRLESRFYWRYCWSDSSSMQGNKDRTQ